MLMRKTRGALVQLRSCKTPQVNTDALWSSELSMRRRRGGSEAGSEGGRGGHAGGASGSPDLQAELGEVRRQLAEQSRLLTEVLEQQKDLLASQEQQARLRAVGLQTVAPVLWSPSRAASTATDS